MKTGYLGNGTHGRILTFEKPFKHITISYTPRGGEEIRQRFSFNMNCCFFTVPLKFNHDQQQYFYEGEC